MGILVEGSAECCDRKRTPSNTREDPDEYPYSYLTFVIVYGRSA
jgi:hypothetical protein